MKRLLTMLLSAALLVSAFAGCGGEGKESSATSGATAGSSSSNQASTEETDWSSQEPYTVKLLIPGDAKTEDVEEVSAAASKILEEKYNTTLEIMRVGFGSYPDQVNLMLSSGEKLDVLYNNRDIFVSAINNGQIISMEEYLPEYGPDLLEQIPEERWATTSLNGEKYAVPANKEVAVSWGFSCVKEMADATGVDYSNIKTEEDLVPLLEAVKEMYPDVWPVVSGGGAMTALNTNDDLGGDIGSLLDCTNPDDTTVINWYASDEYKKIVERRYEWVKKGLIPPDASSSSDQAATQIAAGRGFGQFCNTKPGIEVEHQRSTTKEMLVFTLTPCTPLPPAWISCGTLPTTAHSPAAPSRCSMSCTSTLSWPISASMALRASTMSSSTRSRASSPILRAWTALLPATPLTPGHGPTR